MRSAKWVVLVAVLTLTACDDSVVGPGADAPENVEAEYVWLLEGWISENDGGTPVMPVGDAAVRLRWDLPEEWDGEPFRVYGRHAGAGSYFLVATITSCATSGCLYTDINVVNGESYDYYVVAVDERREREGRPSDAVRIDVPAFEQPAAPVDATVTPMNNALLVRWEDGGVGNALWKYLVFLVEVDGTTTPLYQVGETDGTGFLDLRAQNGTEYTYRIAAVDTLGHVSRMGGAVRGTPSADANAALLYDPGAGLSLDKVEVADEGDPIVAVPAVPSDEGVRVDVGPDGYRLRGLPDQ